MVKSADEWGIEEIIEFVNQIIAEGVILSEWKLYTIVKCYKGKGDALERGNCHQKVDKTAGQCK